MFSIADVISEAEVKAAMDVIIAKNLFKSTGGDLKSRDSAELVDKNSTEFTVK